jgi:hypothetical protein
MVLVGNRRILAAGRRYEAVAEPMEDDAGCSLIEIEVQALTAVNIK